MPDVFGFLFHGIGILVFILLLALYFLPTIIAMVRGRRNTLAIFLLNFFLGWSFIAWVIALVLAVKE